MSQKSDIIIVVLKFAERVVNICDTSFFPKLLNHTYFATEADILG